LALRLREVKMKSKILYFVFILVAVFSFLFLIENVKAALDPNQLEYTVSIGPITGSTTANYVYASLFNPVGSGRTAVIKKISIRVDAVALAVYQSITLRRITAASGGTQILPADVPKKNTGSANTVLEIRHTGVTVTLAGTAYSRLMYVVAPGAAGSLNGYKEVDFGDNEKLILQPGEGIALFQEAAGDVDQRIRLLVEWEEVTTAPAPQGEYLFNYPRVEVAAAANQVYSTFFNPVTSGKTAIVKRIAIEVHCDAAAVYTNNIAIRRITAASGGTLIAAADVPKKHTGSANTAMELRNGATAITVTFAGSVNSRLLMVTPCGAADQAGAVKEIVFASGDEKLILQPGEGIALYTEAAGDADQIVRMFIEWQEVSSASTPASQGEYMITYPRVEKAVAANEAYFTFFNPSTSGKTAIVKRIEVRLDADAAAVYQPITVRRITAASGGTTVIAAADVPKKHTGTANTAMELRATGATAITVTFAGTASSRLLSITGQGAVGQLHARKEIVFGNNEKLILQPGEGIAVYSEAAGDIDQYVKFSIEWDEEVAAPSSQGEYMLTIGPISGSTTAGFNYAAFFNPATSGKTAVVKRVWIGVDAVAAAVNIPITLQRITASSLGTAIAAAYIPKKHSGTVNSVMDIRHTGPTVTKVGTAAARIVSVTSPGAAGTATAPQLTGHKELIFVTDEPIILKPGEGFVLYQEAAGDADFRVKLLVEWQEVTTAPASQGDYILSIGPVSGSTTAGYVYGSLFNPTTSNKNYAVKRIEIRVDAVAAAVYIPVTVKRITAASAGTLIAATDIPKKHTGTVDSTAEARFAGVTATLTGDRILGVTSPGAAGLQYGIHELVITFQDELVLKPGEGLALFQEDAGDLDFRVSFAITWNESAAAVADTTPPVITVQSPTNTSTVFTNIWANVTLDEPGESCRVSLDGGVNNTMTNSSGNWNYLLTDVAGGPHNVVFVCRDLALNTNSTQVFFTVTESTIITLNISTVNFGTIISGSENTTDLTPFPFVVQNDGNVNVNLTIYSTDLWSSVSNPSPFFQFNVSENETGTLPDLTANSINVNTSFPSKFVQMPATPVWLANRTKWQNSTDALNIHLNITVPPDEPGTTKTATVTITAVKS
jgi:hypothetical protein